jgi:hypothetical protein
MPSDAVEFDEALRRTWTLLLNGWGFNWYRLDNQLQADDILVRNRVCGELDAAGARLAEIEAAYRKRHLPPPTRAAPVPDPARLRAAQAIAALRARIAAIETQVRGSAMPPKDRIWAAHRDHEQMLAALLDADVRLVGAAHEIAACLAAPTEAEAPDGMLARCERYLALLDRALGERKALLEIRVTD